MKKSLHSYLLWLSFLFVISCQKNEEPTPTATLTFLNNDTDNTTYYSYWVVVSDQSGKVLAWKSLPADVSTSLTYQSGKDSVNLTVIKKSNVPGSINDFYYMSTYANVAPGSYSSPLAKPVPSPTIGNYDVQNISPSDYRFFFVYSDCGETSNATLSDYKVNVCANSSLFISMNKYGTQTPRYLYIPQISANGSVVVDQTTYNSLPEMKSKNVTLNDSYSNTSLVSGRKTNHDWYLVSFNSGSYATNSQPVFYPDHAGAPFDEYQVLLLLNKPNITFYYASNVTDVSDFTFQAFTPTLDAVNAATTSNLNYELSGTAHYVQTSFSASNFSTSGGPSHVYNWDIYNSFSKKISTVLPTFPDDLKKEVDLSFINSLKLQSITIQESDLGGYTTVYSNSMLGLKKESKKQRSKSYTPRTDGSIGGGG